MPEVRVTSDTGGQKGSKPQRMDLLPPGALLKISEVYEFGSRKYDDHNWRKGYSWSLSYAAMQRHLNLFWSGQDLDEESGLPHVAHAAFHMFTLLTFMEEQREFDDRFKKPDSFDKFAELYNTDLSPYIAQADALAKEISRVTVSQWPAVVNPRPFEVAAVMNEAPEGTVFHDDMGTLWKRDGEIWVTWCNEEEEWEYGCTSESLNFWTRQRAFSVTGCATDTSSCSLYRATGDTCPYWILKHRFPKAFK